MTNNYPDFSGSLDAQTDTDYEQHHGLLQSQPMWVRHLLGEVADE